MRWNAATDAIARCKATSIAYARKGRSVHALRWTCGVKPKPRGVNKPSKHYMMRVQDEQNPVSLLQSPQFPIVKAPVQAFEALQLLHGRFRQLTTAPSRAHFDMGGEEAQHPLLFKASFELADRVGM